MSKITVPLLVLALRVTGLEAATRNASAARLEASEDSYSNQVLTTTATEEAVDSPDRDRLIASLLNEDRDRECSISPAAITPQLFSRNLVCERLVSLSSHFQPGTLGYLSRQLRGVL